MAETKTCEQCQIEKDIECFYRRPQKHDPTKRMKICIDCYKQNSAESKRRQEEQQRQRQEEQRQREAEQEAEQVAREQARQARALELSIQANKRCPRCKQIRTDGTLWIFSDSEEHFFFSRFCQACTDGTPHVIYRLICPIFKQIRYVGITSQPIGRRLAEHMRGESGTEQKRAWIDTLRAHNLTAQIETIDTAPNEREAQKAEQAWIDHHIRLGCPLTNSEVRAVQHVLDVQSGRVPSHEEKWSGLYSSSRSFRLERASAKRLQIARWYNRTHCAYFLDSAYNPHGLYAFYHYNTEAQEYDNVIFEHTLPERKKERSGILCNVTTAYLYWNENLIIWHKTRKYEDIRYLWDKHIPFICTKVEKDGTSITGFVIGLTRENAPVVHPFSYNVDSARALVVAGPGSFPTQTKLIGKDDIIMTLIHK
jgi:GIY-YIG catalytic domain